MLFDVTFLALQLTRRITRVWGPLLPLLHKFRKLKAKRQELERQEENELVRHSSFRIIAL